MAYTIAVAGKGGSGKTTIASLIAYNLVRAGRTPILAVDADPNSNFSIGLGLAGSETIASLREEALRDTPQGMSKIEFVNMRLQESIIEGEHIDLLVMGRPEGPGCYCAVNNLLRGHLSKVSKSYKYVVVDNEAGLEHLSRRTTDDVDLLLLVSEPTVVGLRSCANVCEIAASLPVKIKDSYLLINKANYSFTQEVRDGIGRIKIPHAGEIPFDAQVIEASEKGLSLQTIPDTSAAAAAVKKMLQRVGVI